MDMTLYGSSISSCTTLVKHVLAEKNLTDYVFVPVDLSKREQKLPEHLSRHPFGKVPVLEDNELTLYESRAIARYIATKYKDVEPPLMPPNHDIRAVARFEQAASVETQYFSNLAAALMGETLIKPRFTGSPVDQKAAAAIREEFCRNLDVLDEILAKQNFMAGEEFSLIDMFYMPDINTLFHIGEGALFTDRQHLGEWWVMVSSRPAWKKTIATWNNMYASMVEPKRFHAEVDAEVSGAEVNGHGAPH